MSDTREVREFLDRVPPTHVEKVAAIRDAITAAYPAVTESIKWGKLIYQIDGTDVFYIDHFADHVNLGFFQGAELPDPSDRLEGTGKRMRHVKLTSPTEVDEEELRQLIDATVG